MFLPFLANKKFEVQKLKWLIQILQVANERLGSAQCFQTLPSSPCAPTHWPLRGRQRKSYPIASWITMISPVNSRISSQTGLNHRTFIASHNYGSDSISFGGIILTSASFLGWLYCQVTSFMVAGWLLSNSGNTLPHSPLGREINCNDHKLPWLHRQNSLNILWVENGLNQYTSEPNAGKRNE